MIDAEFLGQANLARKLAGAAKRAEAAVQRRAEAIGEDMAAVMRERVPVDTGALRDSIRVEPDPDNNGAVVKAGGTPETQRPSGRKGHVFDQALMVEYGTAPHQNATNAGRRQRARAARSTHPGTPAQPFFNPVVNEYRGRIRKELGDAAADAALDEMEG